MEFLWENFFYNSFLNINLIKESKIFIIFSENIGFIYLVKDLVNKNLIMLSIFIVKVKFFIVLFLINKKWLKLFFRSKMM